MTHNKDLAALSHKFQKRVGSHTGSDTAAVFGFFVSATVEAEVQSVLYNSLITATAKRHLNGQSRKFISFFKGRSIHAQTEGN